jgi:hypothetical protein
MPMLSIDVQTGQYYSQLLVRGSSSESRLVDRLRIRCSEVSSVGPTLARRRLNSLAFALGTVVGAAIVGALLWGMFSPIRAWLEPHTLGVWGLTALAGLAVMAGRLRLPSRDVQVRQVWSTLRGPDVAFAWGLQLGSIFLTRLATPRSYIRSMDARGAVDHFRFGAFHPLRCRSGSRTLLAR